MAGTLTISTLSDGTNSTSSTNCIQGSAKAWVRFTGATGTVNASYNVSSVTRSSTGQYTINFTNAFADTNYAFNGTGSIYTGTYISSFGPAPGYTPATSSFQAIALQYAGGGSYYDPLYVSFAFYR
jgi:hypothetical protein